ncbi:RIH domain family protein [Acanthocheilonema viteae]
MTDKEGTGDGEQDDISFLRTGDIVAMTCMASANREGVLGSERVCLCTEGFGNRMCSLENVSDRDLPPDISMCMLYIDNALSVRALQEMMSNDKELRGTGSGGGHKTLLYGHAIQLKHVQSEMYLACLSSCSSNDKLAFDVGVQENNEGEACWWTIHPASKQRSEGEKVRVGDDVILVSVATERYLHMTHSKGFMVIASFHQTLWNITSVSSGSVRIRNMGALFGNDVLRFFHGNDEVLTIPENWSEHPQYNMAIYEGGAAVSQARSLWRIELIRMKWHGALIGWEQPFRIRHITSGRYLGVMENVIQLYGKDKAELDATAFVMYQTKDLKKQLTEEKEEGMGVATIRYGETNAFIQHIKTELWLSYQTSEITKKGLGKVEEKKAVALKDGHMDDCFTFFMALEEESKSARVIRKCSSVLNRFLKGIEALQREGKQAQDWNRADLSEVLRLMEDLIDYFAQPDEDDFEASQNRLRALRSRQDLFQEEGVLNMILDTIDKFSQMEAMPDFAGLLNDDTQLMWEEISTYLYLLVAAMIKGNHYNCAQFASAQRLQWLFGRLSNPQSAEGILDVLYCVLTESPEALNMINESHIKSVISLLGKVGRDPKVLDVLSSLCEGNGMAVRSSQNTITQHLLPGKDLLLQTKMRDHVSSMTPNILVGVVEGSSQFRRWYYEAEVEHIEQMTKTEPYLRIGWANSMGYKPFPGSGDGWGCIGVGDDYYSYGFDGRCIYCATKRHVIWTRTLQKGDIVGCLLDLNIPEISFTVNGQQTTGLFKNFNIDGFFFPVMSLSAKVSCRFMFGGTEGRLRFGPPPGFSALIEAAVNQLEIGECVSFGDIAKNVYAGPSILRQNTEPFVPKPIDISTVVLPHFAMEIHEKLAENLHELWAMRKIELGWNYGEVRDERTRRHPCLTSFQQLPQNEKTYNINLAIDTMKTIEALRYHMILEECPVRLRPVHLPQNYQQSNGFKPKPLDSHEIVLDDNMFPLIDALAKNTHNVWAREKIRRGWTFGLNEFVNTSQKRSPHLVPYEVVDQRIKEANRESATEFIKTLQLFGIFLEAPVLEHDEAAEKELKATKGFSRTYRAEALYAVSSGKWYFEFEVLTSGFMKVGWMDVSAQSTVDIGIDDRSYGFDGYLARKWHQGAVTYGREWKIGDVVGVFLDLSDHTISFSLNGELLLDPSGSEMAFDNVLVTDGFVPAMTFSAGQKAKLNFGQDSNSLKYFTTSGLQEGYEPFCVNMYRQMPMWYAKRLPQFEDIGLNSTIEVSRIPATASNPPCLKITQKEIDTGDMTAQEKTKMEYIRLSLPVKCNDKLQPNKDKESIMRSIHEIEKQIKEEAHPIPTIMHPSIPREFGDDIKVNKKSLGRSLLSAFKHNTEEDESSARSKPISFDGDHTLAETSAMRMSGSMLELSTNDDHRDGKHKRGGLMARFHQRKKEGISSESKRTAGILTDGHIPSADAVSAEGILSSTPKDEQDMPRSGPGRSRRFMSSSKLKKNKIERLLEHRRPSIAALEQNVIVEGSAPSDDVRPMIELSDKIDEFYYAIRIFPGQDPANVWVGWVTPKYHFYAERFATGEAVRRCKFQEINKNVNEGESIEYRNCYVMNAAELLQSVPDPGNTKVSGLLVGCIIDTSIGELSFLASKQDTGFRFKLEPGAILYPAAFVAPTSAEILQFELGRIKYTFPLSSAMFKSSHKSLLPFCPPRLTVEKLNPVHWARVPNECLRTTALKLSDFRGWSILCDDPVRIMSIYVPEKDKSYDILEMIEHNDFLTFHRQTLNLYCKLAAHGNQKVAHILCSHVDEDQIMYAVKSHYLSGPLRQGFHDFLIAVHLRTHVDARQSTAHEYVIPLKQNHEIKNVFHPENEDRFPQILGPTISIRPVIACSEVRSDFEMDTELKLQPPMFNFAALKTHVMLALSSATEHAVINCRDLIGGNCLNHFEPLFKLFNSLLVIGMFDDDDLKDVLKLIHPIAFDENYVPGLKQKGLTEIELAEGVKIQLTMILENICDIQLRHRVESLVSFAAGFVSDLQQDQFSRYMSIKETDMTPAEAARRTKEFRCPPREQMFRLVKCKAVPDDSIGIMLDDDTEYDQCPMDEALQQQLKEFCSLLISKVGCKKNDETDKLSELVVMEEANSWVDQLAQLVIRVPPPLTGDDIDMSHNGTENFRQMICKMLKSWATSSVIESNDLIRNMFSLLLRQYTGVAEMMKALSQTYVLHERNIEDVQDFIENLVQVRELLNVQFESAEETVLKRELWKLMNNRIFFQHPDLMRLLTVHENVMSIMMNVLTAQQGAANHNEHGEHAESIEEIENAKESKDASEMVVACSRFLCYFCRTSRHNQKAMFEHLPFLLDNATMLLARPSLRGSVPLDIAYSSFMENSELALALKEEELDKVTVYLSRCGLQPNSELIAKGYPDIGWDPVEGERYIDFLRFCVWINGESVVENANLVIRLLIRRPDCLGVALKGEGEGLFSAFKEAITLSEDIRALEEDKNHAIIRSALLREQPHYPSKETEGENYIDLGAATLDFYSSLVELLAKCAPDKINIQAGKGDCMRARAILRSLISLDDLDQILALRFTIPNLVTLTEADDAGPLPGLLPNHKQSVLLFLDRVYGIDSQEMLFHFLEKSFLPDLRAATMMDSPCSVESDTALALNRYLCNAVLPLLTTHSYYFANAEHHAALLDTTLHTVYSMNRLRSLTKNQRDALSDFLVAITHELPPAMMVKLMRKVINDIQEMDENLLVPLRIVTFHYERCTKYYGSGNIYGVASETEKRLSMLLFYAIFDSLGSRQYDPELFGKALPCLTAIGSAISPDYTLTTTDDDTDKIQKTKDRGVWNPNPVDVSEILLDDDLKSVIAKFAEHFHDSWASRKIEKGWSYGELYSRQDLTHPRLKPFALLPDFEKNFYKERCAECLRALLVWNYSIELTDHDAADKAIQNNTSTGTSIENFNPKPVDLSNMTLEKDMTGVAEKMAEESHKIWAKKVFSDLSKGGTMPPQLVPWDLLTDFERRKDRFRAAEILKFLQYYGYRVWSSTKDEPSAERVKIDSERSSVEKRFAYNLLKKLIQYLEQSSLKMKTIKPSQELTRQNSFKKEGQDVKFFEKVVLPLMHAYFNAHKNYFLASSSIVQTGMASDKEKEMVASLFCRLASLLRFKNHAFGSVAKITVRCLQGLTQALDLRTLVKINSDIVRTGLLTFFNNCADDLFSAMEEVQKGGQYSLLRGQNLKSWVSLEFANQMIIPVLTTMFVHLAVNHFGSDLLLDEIQAACYKILDSVYLMHSLAATTSQRKSIAYEMDKHRPALGQCLAAFAGCFPVAFLEDKFNKNNKYSLLAKSQDQSVQVQEMLQNLLAHIPQMDKLLTDVEQVGQSGTMYCDQPAIYDVDLPLICSYLTYWWQLGPDSTNRSIVPITDVSNEHINRIFRALLQMIHNHIGVENASWLCRINFFSVQIIPYVSYDVVKDYMLPVAERLRRLAEKAYREEEHIRTHPDNADEGTVAEDNAHLVRDVYAYFPILMKYTDLHRAQWLKSPSWETDGIYENVAVIFKIWSLSQHFKREELNFMAQYEDESVIGGTGEMKTGKAAIAERKKKRREGQMRKDKRAGSIVIACLKRLLPVGLNVFGGRELDIVQQAKEKFLAKEPEDKIRELVRSLLEIPAKTDPTDKNAWQLNLYRKIEKSQMRNKDTMTLDGVVEKITSMGQVVAILHVTEHPQSSMVNAWKTMISSQRKRAVVACFRMIPLYGIPRHRAINFFLPAFNKLWLEDEDVGQDALIKELTLEDVRDEQTHGKAGDEEVLSDEKDEKSQSSPDPLRQLIQCFQRAATSEQSQTVSISNDSLFVNFAQVMSKSVHIEDEDEGDDEGELDQAQKEEISQALRAEQAVLANRGAAIMCLMYLSASNGEPSDMVAEALQLGIHLLNGGNSRIQQMLIDYLQLKKDVRFFTSLAGLMNKCSVLNLEMFERQIKAEGLGMGAELGAAADQNLNDSEFTCSLFRFLQLTCEGHNLEFQNYLRAQPGHTTSVNLINCTVDYLLRLQESVMDFYWHYSSKDVIDEGGKDYFLRAIRICSQVFNTLTESIQGPCTGNQMTLANSRLWDAINGFFFLFAHMMEKLYKNSTQLELLREFLNLQKDMIVLMLSMLEGNVLNGSIGKQMVDALVESEQNVEMILKFSDMFLKLKDLTTSQAFQDFDTNRDGWISPKEFQRAMESQKMYSVEEITYLMMCTDVNNDGKVDYMEFTERFHNPARDIGFNIAVLLTNLKEHITSDPRLEKIIKQASSLLEYFDPYLGRIEIMGSSKKVEKIYFEIQESWLEQWSKQQIRDSKNSFLFNVLQDDGGDQGKLEAFINFCEDTIFEMQHAAEISAGDLADSKIERAKKQRDYFLQQTSAGAQISATFKTGFSYGINAANALKPANVKRIFNTANASLRSMTWAQLIFAIIILLAKVSMKVAMFIYLIICTFFRFGYYLMISDRDELEMEQAALPMPESTGMQYASPVWPPLQQYQHSCNYDIFGVRLPSTHPQVSATSQGQSKTEVINASASAQQSETVLKPSGIVQQDSSLYETQSINDITAHYKQVASPTVSEYGITDYYEPKIAEQIPPRSRGSLLNMLARNFKTIEKATLYLAFFINVILLFHRIRIPDNVISEAENDEGMESVYISGVILPYTSYEVTGWMLAQLLYWISVLHAVASFALLVSFYQLKIPLITFKREKEVARRLMFDGCWLTEDDDEERSLTSTVFWYIDRIVISSKSFPMKYWDKFVRRKTRHKFRDQIDEETLTAVLGEDKSTTDASFDYRYACWLWLGVILTNGQFLYRVHYLLCSALGVFVSPFFYAFHLIDVVLSFPMLKAILQSVTHNLQQLILTIMMTLVVVYLYTVLAFNFFRKFYVQQSEGEDPPDRKCHNMLTCFIYHFYAGVRAGGGIGDELESPYGDDLEYWRMLYDISFFFFVIIILLAIMQGLIIDAFGELRDQQESATEKLESSCFICDIGKETFDRMPRGFEIHISKEHNFANYLFFLQHLVNKDETEYTGQETYVREKYDNRDWEFFPVGECFMKQYEDQLLQS